MAKDNAHLDAKLELRRSFLKQYHADPLRVMDCCQATGVIWGQLRKEFKVATYFGMDMKSKPGRLRIDSSRMTAMPLDRYDVIDIDTYGSPWNHWVGVLKNMGSVATVFLTVGCLGNGRGNHGQTAFQAGGIKLRYRPEIAALLNSPAVGDYCVSSLLTRGCDFNIITERITEAVIPGGPGSARYFGVRLKREQPGCSPAVR